jgi:hypothetical protein
MLDRKITQAFHFSKHQDITQQITNPKSQMESRKDTSEIPDTTVQEADQSVPVEISLNDALPPHINLDDGQGDDDEDDDSKNEAMVQLGFVEPPEQPLLFYNTDWSNWDGGKVGGWPVSVSCSIEKTFLYKLCRYG